MRVVVISIPIVVLAVACGRGRGAAITRPTDPKPAVASEAVAGEAAEPELGTPACGLYAMKVLPRRAPGSHASSHPAMASAEAAAEQAATASEGGDHVEAARRYLACATRHREVPEDHPLRAAATANAEICYENAIYSYANAGRFAAEGRAVIERAVAEDPRHADFLRARLADPPSECTTR